MEIGERLSYYRRRAGLSQKDAANLINVSRQCLSNWETNHREPRIEDLWRLCRLYNITLDQFVKDNI
ncbi:helix-turn-helix domain-containing protein [Diplocloster hominis]|uniref:helix-turn-helix domain-containing protein n=1 Tax=Diplocloster hominis TaxID=3079010 RepID=UPI003CCEFD89